MRGATPGRVRARGPQQGDQGGRAPHLRHHPRPREDGAAGEYRADLYYRINVVSITLPPLRERREDVPALVAHFIDRYNKENGRQLKVAPEAMKVLTSCHWPGNVREPDGERERLIWAMEQCGWVQAKAARLLRITPRQRGYALQKNRIDVRKF